MEERSARVAKVLSGTGNTLCRELLAGSPTRLLPLPFGPDPTNEVEVRGEVPDVCEVPCTRSMLLVDGDLGAALPPALLMMFAVRPYRMERLNSENWL